MQPWWWPRHSAWYCEGQTVFDCDSGIEPLWRRHNAPVKELYCPLRLMKYVGEAEHKEEVTLLCCLARQKPSLYMWQDKRTVIKTRPPFSGWPFWESPPSVCWGLNVSGRGAERMRSLRGSSLSDECFPSRRAPRLILRLDNRDCARNWVSQL